MQKLLLVIVHCKGIVVEDLGHCCFKSADAVGSCVRPSLVVNKKVKNLSRRDTALQPIQKDVHARAMMINFATTVTDQQCTTTTTTTTPITKYYLLPATYNLPRNDSTTRST